MESCDKDKGKNKTTKVKTFSVPFAFGEINENSWFHYAIVDDGSKMTSYINGEKMVEQSVIH